MRQSQLFADLQAKFAGDDESLTYGLLLDVTEQLCTALARQGLTLEDWAKRRGVSVAQLRHFLDTSRTTTVQEIVGYAKPLGLRVEIKVIPVEEA